MLKAFAKQIPFSEVNTLSSLALAEEAAESAVAAPADAPQSAEEQPIAPPAASKPAAGDDITI
jgi:hypothetical protein